MTSEVVIFNRNAVTMAADSAVTVNGIKTYEGVNKLFMLSNTPPMGIMIFGLADFESIPMETLNNEFKSKTEFDNYGDIESITDRFLKFLGKTTPETDIEKEISTRLSQFKKIINKETNDMDAETFEEFLITVGKKDLPKFIDDIPEFSTYKYDFDELIPNDTDKSKYKLLVSILKNNFLDYMLSMSTGIVIAGFNENEMFPSCIRFNLHFNYNGEIKISKYDSMINYKGNAILPFAQQDVMKTFLTGIDDSIKDSIVIYFDYYLNDSLHELKNNIMLNSNIKGVALNEINHEIDKIINNKTLSYEFLKKC